MQLHIKKKVFQHYPKLQIAFILLEKIDNRTKLKEAQHLLHEIEQFTCLSFTKATLESHPLITPWKVAQEHFGKLAKHYQTSVQRLLYQVLKKEKITTKDTLTNLINYLALKHIIPLGVDDYQKLTSPLTFTLATGKEKVGILHTLRKDALYYHDNNNILGTKLDYWKNNKTKLTKKSTNVLIHLEILPPITAVQRKTIVKELQQLSKTFCGSTSKVLILNQKKNKGKI